ncbi:hypothetical protein JTB14_002839 [Gonioctena quinquepunctata]|nr:hypothetical protein JTB14_002839 [Gonioctena quinquepunctata]
MKTKKLKKKKNNARSRRDWHRRLSEKMLKRKPQLNTTKITNKHVTKECKKNTTKVTKEHVTVEDKENEVEKNTTTVTKKHVIQESKKNDTKVTKEHITADDQKNGTKSDTTIAKTADSFKEPVLEQETCSTSALSPIPSQPPSNNIIANKGLCYICVKNLSLS